MSLELTETEEAIVEPTWVCTGSSANMLWILAWCLGTTPKSGSGCLWLFCLFLGLFDYFPSTRLPFSALKWVFVPGLILDCAVFDWFPWEAYSFLDEKKEGRMWGRGEFRCELGGVEGREAVIRLSCMRKE